MRRRGNYDPSVSVRISQQSRRGRVIRSYVTSILSAVSQAGHWLVVTSSLWTPEVLAQTNANFDRGMRVGILSTITVFLVLAGVSIWRLMRREGALPTRTSRAV